MLAILRSWNPTRNCLAAADLVILRFQLSLRPKLCHQPSHTGEALEWLANNTLTSTRAHSDTAVVLGASLTARLAGCVLLGVPYRSGHFCHNLLPRVHDAPCRAATRIRADRRRDCNSQPPPDPFLSALVPHPYFGS